MLLQRANVIHQCGTASITDLTRHAKTLDPDLAGRYRVTAFIGIELPDVLTLADVVISRGGAGTIADLTAAGKPALLIPLASAAGNEQAYNAQVLSDAGAAVALLDEVTSDSVRAALTRYSKTPAVELASRHMLGYRVAPMPGTNLPR
ncbi:glycosyltransferase [Nocardia transvalensis]|uniref:glycosyltransferase n=1 Tax=Nocardia transvalensis TaxID=37333 RepID=UPI002B4B4F5B|nr:glycosyltransferase [Nocardia transvalensis]